MTEFSQRARSAPPKTPLNDSGNLNDKAGSGRVLARLPVNNNMDLQRLCVLKSLKAEVQLCHLLTPSFHERYFRSLLLVFSELLHL